MFNTPNSYPGSGSDADLLKRLTQRVQEHKVGDQMLVIMQRVFENALDQETLILSRAERVRLYRQVTKTVLADMLGKLDDAAQQK